MNSQNSSRELSHGHPLVTRYLIEALRNADAQGRVDLLAGAMTFDGDIQTIYASAWRVIQDDDDARHVLDFLARAEGPMPLTLLAHAVNEPAFERALRSTRHLLDRLDAGDVRALYGRLIPMVHDGALHTAVEASYPLDRITEAVLHAQAEGRSGKVLLQGGPEFPSRTHSFTPARDRKLRLHCSTARGADAGAIRREGDPRRPHRRWY